MCENTKEIKTKNYSNKVVFSKNEKILRLICYCGIILCGIIGILLFFLNKIGIGIGILCACSLSIFLITPFVIGKVKKWFKNNESRRIFYALCYMLIILIPMLTAFIGTYNISYSMEEMQESCILEIESQYKNKGNIKACESTILERFETNGNYYYCFETKIEVTSPDGAVLRDYPISFVMANKYTGRITIIDEITYQRAKM